MQLYQQLWPVVDEARNALWRDKHLSNRAFGEIESDLWVVLNEIIDGREAFRDTKSLRQKLNQFAESLVRPTDEYEIAISIDYLRLPDHVAIKVAGTEFVHFDQQRANDWGLRDGGIAGDIVGHAAGIARVHAGTFERARELAEEQIDTGLAVVRVAMASSRTTAPLDDLYLQRRGSLWAGRRITGAATSTGGYHRGFAEVNLDLRDTLSSAAQPLLQAANAMGQRVTPLLEGTVAPTLASALIRAIEWIGSSITRESYDDKIVDLCTAMECMLALESDRLKGQSIALRYLLLIDRTGGGNYNFPHAVLPIYERRSLVIHGARRRIASGKDYQLMREISLNTLNRIIRLLESRPDFRSVAQLVDFLESDPERIESVPQMILSDTFKPDREVIKHAAAVAANVRQRLEASAAPPTV